MGYTLLRKSMSRLFAMRFWNHPDRVNRRSPHDKIKDSHRVPNVGCLIDPTDRGQPNRFDKWYKYPEKAHRLYWRVRGIDWHKGINTKRKKKNK